MSRQSFRWIAALLMLTSVMLAGCNRDEDRIDGISKSVRSWSAAIKLASEQRAAGAVPALYLRQLLDAAEKDLSQQACELQKISDARERASLEQQLAALRRNINSIRSAGAVR